MATKTYPKASNPKKRFIFTAYLDEPDEQPKVF